MYAGDSIPQEYGVAVLVSPLETRANAMIITVKKLIIAFIVFLLLESVVSSKYPALAFLIKQTECHRIQSLKTLVYSSVYGLKQDDFLLEWAFSLKVLNAV